MDSENAKRVEMITRHLMASNTSAVLSPGEELRSFRKSPTSVRSMTRSPDAFSIMDMKRWLDHDNHAMRDELRDYLSDPIFEQKYHVNLEELRALALQRLKKVCAQPGRFISVNDFRTNPQRVFAAHEICCLVDGSLATKLTVNFNLFGGTVLKLGTKRHHQGLLEKIDSIEQVGCFALTELGYGNNAIEMETTAVYDECSKEFIINTPNPLAQKYWITNAAQDSSISVVFAQTTVNQKEQGVHAFLVPIRNADMSPCAGVTIEE